VPPANTNEELIIPLVNQRDTLLLRLDRLDRLLRASVVIPVDANDACS
jgi:hypothetical protein